MTPCESGLLIGCILGVSVTLLVLVAVYVRAESAHHEAELHRAWQREVSRDA